MKPGTLIPCLCGTALALAAAAPAQGGTRVTTSVFSLTFPDGWQYVPPGVSEFPVVVLDSTLDVSCLLTTVSVGHATSEQDLHMPASTYSRGDSVFKVEEGTKTLGGRTFLFAEYHGEDSGGQTKQVRAYYDLYDSTHLLCAFLDYLSPMGDADIAPYEQALAGLEYSDSVPVPLLPPPARSRPAPERAPRRDALGRPRNAPARVIGFPAAR